MELEIVKQEFNNFSQICPVFEYDNVQMVDARKLHLGLGVKRKFAGWIQGRIKGYGFIENIDYIKNPIISIYPKRGIKGKQAIEYWVSLDMAKELAMIEHNEKGRQVRQYFIACEKALKLAFMERGNQLALENENLQREKLFWSKMAAINAKAVEKHKKAQGQISSSREAKVLQENVSLKKEIKKLKNILGIGEEWKRVAAIDWLWDYFYDCSQTRTRIGHELTKLSNDMNIPVKFIGEPPAGTRRVYHMSVIGAFKFRVQWDLDYLAAHRKKIIE